MEYDEQYVCITHKQLAPCLEEKYHLFSNWPSDVKKILENENN
jgi:hypothetical protein